ncbi:hypothetical protein [uncultured Sphingomonas sp.]|uniref:hypothetical protein n=1 Tax=uncultured Sphingomonas sp. TaxID=158754 RepID=UPI0035CC08EB
MPAAFRDRETWGPYGLPDNRAHRGDVHSLPDQRLAPRHRDGSGRIAHPRLLTGAPTMQDILWIAITIGLLALTLAYFRLCEKA